MKKLRPRGFTLVELLVVIAVIAVLAAMLLPSLQKVRRRGWDAVCMSNLRQLNTAVILYADDDDDYFPPAAKGTYFDPVDRRWGTFLDVYLSGKSRTLFCPASRATIARYYGSSVADPWSLYWYNDMALGYMAFQNPSYRNQNKRSCWTGAEERVFSFSCNGSAYPVNLPVHLPYGPSTYAGYGVTLTGRAVHCNEASTSTERDFNLYWLARCP